MVEIGEENGSSELRELQGIAELWARMDETARLLVVANGSNEERYRGVVGRCVVVANRTRYGGVGGRHVVDPHCMVEANGVRLS